MKKARRCWWLPTVSLLLTALLCLFIRFFTEPHYALSDDFYLARAFAGEVGGVPESYNLHVHTVLAWLLHGLTLLFPGIWWFSWAQVGFCALGAFCVLLGLARLTSRLRLPVWTGFAGGAVFLFVFAMEAMTAVTFTTTCALLGAGGVCLLAGVRLEGDGRRLPLALLCSVAPIVCAYLLRATAAVPALAFWVGLLLCRLLWLGRPARARCVPPSKPVGDAHREDGPAARAALTAFPVPPRAIWRGLALVAAVWLALVGVRAAENALTSGEAAYREFLNATTTPIDYNGLDSATPETLALNGWTEKEVALIRSWYFLDENMNAEAFRRVEQDALSVTPPPLLQRALAAVKGLLARVERYPSFKAFCLACLALCLGAFLAACLQRRSPRLWRCLAPVGCAGVAGLLLFYLAFEGRLPLRAAATVLLPACAMALCLAFEGLASPPSSAASRPDALPRLLAMAGLLAALLVSLPAGVEAFQVYYHPNPYDPDQCVYHEVDAYALANPQALLIGDRTLGVDSRLFPDRSAGSPANLLPMWGGWNNHSQGYRAVFARYGLDHDHFTITAFLGDQVRLIAGAAGPSPEFLAYLEEQAGCPVQAVPMFEGNGFTVYRFRAAS